MKEGAFVSRESLEKIFTAWHATFISGVFKETDFGLFDWTRAICDAEIKKYGEQQVCFTVLMWFKVIKGRAWRDVIKEYDLVIDYELLNCLVVGDKLIYGMRNP